MAHRDENAQLLEILRRRVAPTLAELREWAKRDTDPWKVDARRKLGGIALENRGAKNAAKRKTAEKRAAAT